MTERLSHVGQQIRGMHQYCFRSGVWAEVVRDDLLLANRRPAYLVKFADGVTDVWLHEPGYDYEFRTPEPVEVGDYIQLNEDVIFGPIVVLRVIRAYKNGNIKAVRTDGLGRETTVWGVHYKHVTKCERDTPPSKAWIEKLVNR